MFERVARRLVISLLERIESGQLTLVEEPTLLFHSALCMPR